jgi:beta-glucosidase
VALLGLAIVVSAGLFAAQSDAVVDATPAAPAAPAAQAARRPELPRVKAEHRLDEKLWVKLHRKITREAENGDVDLLFLGDSITQGWNGNPIWKRHYGAAKPLNAGIWSDRTQHVLWRLRHGVLDGISPKVVVLLVGTNNVGMESPRAIAGGVNEILEEIARRSPKSKVLLLGIFPAGAEPDTAKRKKITATNTILEKLADGERVVFLDIGRRFLQKDGRIPKSVMFDGLHLTRRGYAIWAKAMQPTLNAMLH